MCQQSPRPGASAAALTPVRHIRVSATSYPSHPACSPFPTARSSWLLDAHLSGGALQQCASAAQPVLPGWPAGQRGACAQRPVDLAPPLPAPLGTFLAALPPAALATAFCACLSALAFLVRSLISLQQGAGGLKVMSGVRGGQVADEVGGQECDQRGSGRQVGRLHWLGLWRELPQLRWFHCWRRAPPAIKAAARRLRLAASGFPSRQRRLLLQARTAPASTCAAAARSNRLGRRAAHHAVLQCCSSSPAGWAALCAPEELHSLLPSSTEASPCIYASLHPPSPPPPANRPQPLVLTAGPPRGRPCGPRASRPSS